MRRPRRALIVMAKRPEPGATKKRLAPPLTPDSAAQLYECFLLDTLDFARSLPDVKPFVAVLPVQPDAYFRDIAPDVEQVQQLGKNLGERLDHVLTHCLAAGFDHVAAIGSDVPTLPAWHVTEAFDLLTNEAVDMVLGPSEDGGYHLIAWKRPYPQLVRPVQMSTSRVLNETLDLAKSEGVRVALLPKWYDIDEPEDLERLKREIRSGSPLARHTSRFFERGIRSD